jgi:hypothetical protein
VPKMGNVRARESAEGGMLEAFRLGGMLPREHQTEKNPLPVTNLRRGYQRRAVWTPTHTAHLRAGRRLHRSAPLCKGYCHTDRPTTNPRLHTYC